MKQANRCAFVHGAVVLVAAVVGVVVVAVVGGGVVVVGGGGVGGFVAVVVVGGGFQWRFKNRMLLLRLYILVQAPSRLKHVPSSCTPCIHSRVVFQSHY